MGRSRFKEFFINAKYRRASKAGRRPGQDVARSAAGLRPSGNTMMYLIADVDAAQ
jgi:hypothetical protein